MIFKCIRFRDMEKLSDCKLFDILLFIAITKTDFINKYELERRQWKTNTPADAFSFVKRFCYKNQTYYLHIASKIIVKLGIFYKTKIIYDNYITITYININWYENCN